MMAAGVMAWAWMQHCRRVALAVAILIMIGLAMGCGATPKPSTLVAKVASGVRTAHSATNRARDAFLAANKGAEQAALVASRMTSDPTAALSIALAQLDRAREPVLKAFAAAYSALGAAEAIIPLVENGNRDPVALIGVALQVARAAEDLRVALAAMGVQ